jgi:uncharacterized membrane protein
VSECEYNKLQAAKSDMFRQQATSNNNNKQRRAHFEQQFTGVLTEGQRIAMLFSSNSGRILSFSTTFVTFSSQDY